MCRRAEDAEKLELKLISVAKNLCEKGRGKNKIKCAFYADSAARSGNGTRRPISGSAPTNARARNAQGVRQGRAGVHRREPVRGGGVRDRQAVRGGTG